MARQIFDRLVQVRLGDDLRKRLVSRADHDGVHVAAWARSAILAALSKASPAEVPERSGGEKLTIRFRSTDFNSVEVRRKQDGRKLSDFLRAVLTDQIASGFSSPSGHMSLQINGRAFQIPVWSVGKKKKRKKRARAKP